MNILSAPTMRLLNSSTVVAIGGGLRLHIAFLLAGLAIQIPEYCACSLIIYATYTLDRALDCKEDAINRSDLHGADPRVALLACLVAFLFGALIFARDGIYLAPIFPFIMGYLYTRGIHIGSYSFKLKGGAGTKNIVIGITWAGSIALVVSHWCSNLVTVSVIFLFFALKVFTTSCVNDFKDVRGDLSAGIRTLPVILGEKRSKLFLVLILVTLYGIALGGVYFGAVQNEWIILTFSLILTIVFLAVYTPSFEHSPILLFRKMREIVISWEYALALGLRACVTG
ncbi:MAG TPA: UbiA family prenyltransferase [Methanoregula sp.]|nr:UbiA family prenyltransferase [Methanoregula sp.]